MTSGGRLNTTGHAHTAGMPNPRRTPLHRRLERIGEQESAHLHKYQRALAKLTSSVTEISA